MSITKTQQTITHRRVRSKIKSESEVEIQPKGLIKDETKQKLLRLFKSLPTSTQSLLKRVAASCLLLSGFAYLIYGGPTPIILTMMLAQYKCVLEVLTIAFVKYGVQDIPIFKYTTAYFLFSANFFFFYENIAEYYTVYYSKYDILRSFYVYHRFISFCMHFIGFIFFVLTLKKGYYRRQFSLLAWTHVILLIIVSQAYLVVKSVFEGKIWFVISIATITCNDIMAFIFGRLFGRTPLIDLSPKKTWEGFIGAGISTVILGVLLAHWLCHYEAFICPVEYRNINDEISMFTQCEPSQIFQRTTYNFLLFQIETFPFVWHSFWLALFGSVVAPFGGFFASGFKRAFKIKDFGDTIPGHGGILDRFDCQLIMLTFVHVYISSFIRSPSVEKMLEKVLYMEQDQQIEFYHMLHDVLKNNGMVQ